MSETFTDFEIELNLETVDAWSGDQRPLVPVGDYNLTIIDFRQASGKSSQQPYLAATFEIADGEYVGQRVYNNYSLSPKAVGRLKSLMLACRTELTRIVAAQFMNQTIRASIVHVEGKASIDANGNTLPPKMFANVVNEQPLDEVPVAKPALKVPPVLATKLAPKATANGAPRRA